VDLNGSRNCSPDTPVRNACRGGLGRHQCPTGYGLGFVLGACVYYDIVKIMTGYITSYRISAAT
jgi:hypothetical protein